MHIYFLNPWDQFGAQFNYSLFMIPGQFDKIRIICQPDRSPEDGKLALGDDNVSLAGLVEPVYDHICQTGIDGHHYTGPRQNRYVNAGQGANFARPGTGCVDKDIPVNIVFAMGLMIKNPDTCDGAVCLIKTDDFGKIVNPGTVGSGCCKKMQGQPPGIDGGVRYLNRRFESRI
jgi:hypothetical protein